MNKRREQVAVGCEGVLSRGPSAAPARGFLIRSDVFATPLVAMVVDGCLRLGAPAGGAWSVRLDELRRLLAE